MKIAIFTGNYNHIRDGVSLTLNRLVDYLESKGVNVLVFGPTVAAPAIKHKGTLIAVPSLPLPGRSEYRFSRSFPPDCIEKLSQFDPDIVHIATPDLLGLKALRWALKNEKPIVSSYHTHFSSYLKYYRLGVLEPVLWKYLRWFYRHCEQVYVPSESMISVLENQGIDTDLKIWARGIDHELFNPRRRDTEWRTSVGFGDSDVVITFVSRLVWEKNLKLFSNVVNELRDKYPQVKPLIAGDGPALSGVRKSVRGGTFTGFITGTDLARVYASSDLFFFPSDTETFGNVTLEAMASGLPCIVADASGSRSLVRHGENGYVIPVERSDIFYKLTEDLITDNTLRVRMSEKSLEMSQKYSWDAINGTLLGYYKDLLGKID
ncbi:MAG: glycosyltransferase family 1 protein [Balneolaceae bacterium]|nr:MAG: glycosyltransferase family 1 protein [Balneolaceae bacterium]